MKNTCIIVLFAVLTGCNTNFTEKNDRLIFTKTAQNPVLEPDSAYVFYSPVKKDSVRWQKADVFNPAAIVKDNRIYLLFRAEDNPAAILGGRTSRIGLAYSDDGIHFTKYPVPVLYPDLDDFAEYDQPGGCEDPRIVQTEDSLFVLAYTSWNYKVARLSIAFSKDLIHWEKKGPAFLKAHNGKFANRWSKSGSIITEIKDGRQIAARIKDKYWMYWGEDLVNLAWSDNLYDWNPLLNDTGELKALIRPRDGKFDSRLTECGPPAIITRAGIELYYNGKNSEEENADPALPKGTYSVGRVIFRTDDMETIVYRSDTCILKPTLPHEISGQYKAGTVFAEGLVLFMDTWYLYYGTADSFVGLATAPAK